MYKIFNADVGKTEYAERDGNFVMYSSFKEFYSKVTFKNFSIKYVMNGHEIYDVNGTKYHLGDGQYLLANAYSEGSIEIDSNKTVKGICIDIVADILSEVVASHCAPDTAIPDLVLDQFFNSNDFLENQYSADRTNLGLSLRKLDAVLGKDPFNSYQFNNEFYYLLSEGIVADHLPIFKKLRQIRTVKTETRKDLFRKVDKGKQFIDDNFSLHLDVERVAHESQMSQYHFFRIFKKVYNVSPYQYIKQKRLQFAHQLLLQGYCNLSQLAIDVGFADMPSFSKAFKSQYGQPPSALLL